MLWELKKSELNYKYVPNLEFLNHILVPSSHIVLSPLGWTRLRISDAKYNFTTLGLACSLLLHGFDAFISSDSSVHKTPDASVGDAMTRICFLNWWGLTASNKTI